MLTKNQNVKNYFKFVQTLTDISKCFKLLKKIANLHSIFFLNFQSVLKSFEIGQNVGKWFLYDLTNVCKYFKCLHRVFISLPLVWLAMDDGQQEECAEVEENHPGYDHDGGVDDGGVDVVHCWY